MASARFDISITELLHRYSGGDRDVAETLFREILPTLHNLALRQLNRERQTTPVSPTELINEIWIRNLRHGKWTVANREHFYAIASLAMRQVLVDMARSRLALIRGGGQVPISIDDTPGIEGSTPADLERIVEIGRLMERLEEKDPVNARLVDLQYFAGYTVEEISEITGVPEKTIRNRLKKAMDWLKKRLGD